MLSLPDYPFRAYLFDCDGTIADSMPLHYRAWKRVLDAQGCVFPEEQFYATAGQPAANLIAALNKQHGLAMDAHTVQDAKEAAYLSLIEEVAPIADVVDIIHRTTLPMAVVSGGPRDVVMRTLTALKLVEKFGAIVCAEDYVRGKPAPDPFLAGAQLLGIAANECLVFEDAPLGIESAVAAGMQHVLVPRPTR
ncbi:MAG TPA: HAD family phosphatase [Kofleriaceae bacterium]|jgi:HAD superfamily hydrolase (TIGR01509 family)